MKLQLLSALAVLCPAILATPVTQATTTTPAPTCTTEIFKNPSFQTDCTFRSHTTTSTIYSDCGGCELITLYLGHGLPCQTITTIPGTETQRVTSCADAQHPAATGVDAAKRWEECGPPGQNESYEEYCEMRPECSECDVWCYSQKYEPPACTGR